MPSERLQKPVLVLNASYEPINVCAARRALVLVLKGVASAEEVSVTSIHSARNAVHLPSVIRLLEYRRIPRQTRALSRKNILMRDRYTCQYCHRTMPSGELTLDHVIPRSRAACMTGRFTGSRQMTASGSMRRVEAASIQKPCQPAARSRECTAVV